MILYEDIKLIKHIASPGMRTFSPDVRMQTLLAYY